MVSKILLVRNVIQETLGIKVTPEDADTIIERIEALLAKEAVENAPACLPDGHHGSSLECMHPFCIAEREQIVGGISDDGMCAECGSPKSVHSVVGHEFVPPRK